MWQAILKGLGGVLSFLFDIIPSYGLAIILLTILIRVVLLPLTIKQTRSMQAMQKIQPEVKALQQKYKGDRQKMNEELMRLYKEHQVNPLGGCLPLLLQLPVFIALYSVLRGDAKLAQPAAIAHLPEGSALAEAITSQSASFLGMNLGCAPTHAGRGDVPIPGTGTLQCGDGLASAIPFYALVALMVFTTYYQQKQMQQASGQQQPQMQLMLKIMPFFLGFISLTIPAGVLVYWVTTNLWQVGQQTVMLRAKARAEVEGSAGTKAAGAKGSAGPKKPQATSRTEPPKSSGGKKSAGSRKKRRKR